MMAILSPQSVANIAIPDTYAGKTPQREERIPDGGNRKGSRYDTAEPYFKCLAVIWVLGLIRVQISGKLK